MANKWIEHVKDFAKKNNIAYGCAISNPECKRLYQETKKQVHTQHKSLMEIKNDISDIHQSFPMTHQLIKSNRRKTKFIHPMVQDKFNKLIEEYKSVTGSDYGYDIKYRPNTKEGIKAMKQSFKEMEKSDKEYFEKKRIEGKPDYIVKHKKKSGVLL